MTATLITCSFRGDLDICRLLCRSVDLFAGPEFTHRLYVPRRDFPLFADLESPRRQIFAQESLLPFWFWKAPLPGPKWRARLGLPRRNVYLTPRPVRGWIAQQIMKIAASLKAPDEIVVHLDSDAALVQPLRLEQVERHFYAGPVAERLPGHALWYEAAGRLLALAPDDPYRADYIAPLVVWRRSLVEAMTARIAAVSGASWPRALSRTPHFSEYVLYGLFAQAKGVEGVANSHCLTRWSEGFARAREVETFVATAEADDLICCIQSTLDVSLETRARVHHQVARRIALLQAASRASAA
jgi:hypothetical protein